MTNLDILKNNKILWIPTIAGVCLILSTTIWAVTYYKTKTLDDYLSVTGSASTQIVSDNAKFSGSFSRVVKISGLKDGYDQMARDLAQVKAFLKAQGIDEKSVIISPVSMMENYNYNNNGVQTEKEYNLSQQVEISMNDVNKITALAQSTQALINNGVIFSTNPVEYYYTKLPDLRVSLLSDAVKDAKARAMKLAESSGKSVGNLKSAASGVVQVLPANSLDVSDYGTYDTTKINKTVMVTVKASFGLR